MHIRDDDRHLGGTVAAGFEPVREAFAAVLDGQPGTGAAVAVWCEGRWLVDLWGGHRDAARTTPWERDSLVMPYSVSKPFAAICALILVDRGRVGLDDPMQRHWPEFRARATVRHVLSHQAGIVTLDGPADTSLFYDWAGLCQRLAAQEPRWEPGTDLGESAWFYGHLLGELVRRVDGRSLGTFLRDEVCRPNDLEVAIGLPEADHDRVVELTGLDDAFRDDVISGGPDLLREALSNPPGGLDAAVVNGAAFRRAEIPAINAHVTARGVAGFYAALLEGRILSPGLLAEATTPQATGVDRVMGGEPRSWGLGFGLEDGFGMAGLGGNVGWADTRHGYAIAFVTGSMGDHDRADRLESVLRDCL